MSEIGFEHLHADYSMSILDKYATERPMQTFKMPSGELIQYDPNICDEYGYYYEIHVEHNGRSGWCFLSENQCDFEWSDCEDWFTTNIVPKRLFGDVKELEEKHLVRVIQLLRSTELDKKTASVGQLEEMYQAWMKATEK